MTQETIIHDYRQTNKQHEMEHLKMLTVSKCLCLGCLGSLRYVCVKIGVQKRQERLAEWPKNKPKA